MHEDNSTNVEYNPIEGIQKALAKMMGSIGYITISSYCDEMFKGVKSSKDIFPLNSPYYSKKEVYHSLSK